MALADTPSSCLAAALPVASAQNRPSWTKRISIGNLTLGDTSRSFRAFSALMKTFSAKAADVSRKWWLIDARDQVLGQVALKAANLLRGKEKVILTPHVDTGDFVIVINAEKVRLTGKKEEQIGECSGPSPSAPGTVDRAGRARNDPAQSAGSRNLSETESLSRGCSSPCRTAAAGHRTCP